MKLKLVLMSTALVLAALGTVAVMVRHQTLKLASQERQRVLSLYESSKEGELRHYVELARSAVLPANVVRRTR